MKIKHIFEIIEVNEGSSFDDPDFYFHDDYYSDEEIRIPNDFPFKHLFGDFRIFNGMRLKDMDNFLVKLKELLNEIKNFERGR